MLQLQDYCVIDNNDIYLYLQGWHQGEPMSVQEQYYTRRFTRRYPGLFVILLDQSKSMAQEVEVLDSHTGSYRQVTENRAFWIEPRTQGKTQMAEAFGAARDVARGWLMQVPEPGQAPRHECFPPIIINITDAQDNGSGNPIGIAHEIQREGTQQGSILIFNCHFTTQMGQSYIFPASPQEVAQLDPPFASQICEMSSPMPEPLRKKATAEFGLGREVAPGARCMVYNADTNILIKFLHWGTIGTAIE